MSFFLAVVRVIWNLCLVYPHAAGVVVFVGVILFALWESRDRARTAMAPRWYFPRSHF
jgi:hypothetical protein